MTSSPARPMRPIEKALLGVPIGKVPTLLPGVLLAVVVSTIAQWIADFGSQRHGL